MIPYKKVCRQLCGPAFSNEESYTHIENVFIIFFTDAWPGVQAAIAQRPNEPIKRALVIIRHIFDFI